MKKYDCIAFDLDDTLLDTTSLIVPLAAKNACEAMIEQGLGCDLDTCMQDRRHLAQNLSHTDIFLSIAKKYGARNEALAVHNALTKFYNPELPDFLPLLPKALDNLEQLSRNYRLFLVTMGSEPTQRKKIEALKISHYFENIYIVNGFIGMKKQAAFEDILTRYNCPPERLLSVGNRISSEIRDAKVLGASTCFFSFGEHKNEDRLQAEDNPDFEVTHHQELLKTCGL